MEELEGRKVDSRLVGWVMDDLSHGTLGRMLNQSLLSLESVDVVVVDDLASWSERKG